MLGTAAGHVGGVLDGPSQFSGFGVREVEVDGGVPVFGSQHDERATAGEGLDFRLIDGHGESFMGERRISRCGRSGRTIAALTDAPLRGIVPGRYDHPKL
jgi:hypothetical protein